MFTAGRKILKTPAHTQPGGTPEGHGRSSTISRQRTAEMPSTSRRRASDTVLTVLAPCRACAQGEGEGSAYALRGHSTRVHVLVLDAQSHSLVYARGTAGWCHGWPQCRDAREGHIGSEGEDSARGLPPSSALSHS